MKKASQRIWLRLKRRLGVRIGRLTGGWVPYAEERLSAEDLDFLMRRASIPSFGFFFMLVLSSAIATFGLIANSAPAIIGAMIVAPLMSPILGLAYGLIVFEWEQISRSFLTVVTGTLLVVIFAFVGTQLIGVRIAGPEILSRTSPTLLDLGVAMAAGAAGAFAHSRQSIANSIAGVAIAVALVPPLAVTGIGIALGRDVSAEVGLSLSELGLYSRGAGIAGGSFLLFLTNLVGIVVVAATVMILQGYGNWRNALAGLLVMTVLTVLLMKPLGESLHRLYVKSATLRLGTALMLSRPDLFQGRGRIDSIHVNYRDEVLHVSLDGFVPMDYLPLMQAQADVLQRELSQKLEEPVVVEVEAVPVEILYFKSAPEKETDESKPQESVPDAEDRT